MAETAESYIGLDRGNRSIQKFVPSDQQRTGHAAAARTRPEFRVPARADQRPRCVSSFPHDHWGAGQNSPGWPTAIERSVEPRVSVRECPPRDRRAGVSKVGGRLTGRTPRLPRATAFSSIAGPAGATLEDRPRIGEGTGRRRRIPGWGSDMTGRQEPHCPACAACTPAPLRGRRADRQRRRPLHADTPHGTDTTPSSSNGVLLHRGTGSHRPRGPAEYTRRSRGRHRIPGCGSDTTG